MCIKQSEPYMCIKPSCLSSDVYIEYGKFVSHEVNLFQLKSKTTEHLKSWTQATKP